MARPTKLTPAVQQRIVSAVAAGNYYEAACAYGGVDYTTFRKWMQKGESAKSGPFFELFDACKHAEAEAEVRIIAQWQQHIPDDWRAAQAFAERRWGDRWGRQERHVVQGDAERPLTIRTLTVNVPLLAGNDEILLLTAGDETT